MSSKKQANSASRNQIQDKRVREALQSSMDRVYTSVDRFPWTDERAYANWLAQSYHMTKYTTRVAALTAGYMPIECSDIHKRSLIHLKEENGHELLALNDLKKMGYKIEDLKKTIEASVMVQSQYYFIDMHPAAHFGFVIVLEAIAAQKGGVIINALRSRFDQDCCSFIEIHAEVDQHHVGDLAELINASPEHCHDLMIENMQQTAELYSKMLDGIAGECGAHKAA